MDIKEALLHPATVFSTPEEVRNHPELTKEQKIEILLSWAYDISEILVAEEEGMACEDEPIHLDEIHAALHGLTGKPDTGHSSPTKQGGV